MKKFIRDCKSTLSVTIVLMLLMSMMMGVFSLSANADEEVFNPKVVNNPVLVFTDFDKYLDEVVALSYFDEPCNDYLWRTTLSTISVGFNDKDSKRKVNSINRVTYTYHGDNVEFTDEAFYKTAESFGLLLVNNPLNYHVAHIIEGKYSDKITSYYFARNYRTTRYDYIQFIESIEKAKITLNIYYDNSDEPQSVDVDIVCSDSLPIQRENLLRTGYNTVQQQVITINLSNSNKSDNEAITELDNAIKEVQKIKNEELSRLYADIDSKDPIVLPMDDLSNSVELVQTRVGDNIVYNNQRSVNFGNSAVSSVRDENNDEYDGNIYILPNGSYSSDDDIYELYKYIFLNGYGYYYLVVDDKLYNLNLSNDLDSIPNFKDGYFVKYIDDYYTGIPGSDYDQEKIDDLISYTPQYFKSDSKYYAFTRLGLNRFRIGIKNPDHEKSKMIIDRLNELKTTSFFTDCEREYLYSDEINDLNFQDNKWNDLMIQFEMYAYWGWWGYGYSSFSFSHLDKYPNKKYSDYRDYEFFFGPNYYYSNNQSSYFSHIYIRSHTPLYYYYNNRYNGNHSYHNYNYDAQVNYALPDETSYSLFYKLIDIINDLGIEIDYDNSYYPNINKFFNVDEENKVYVADILDELGVKAEKGKNQSYLAYMIILKVLTVIILLP